ncbi:MAG: TonB-dependent receptor [Betaproteobacteria bacterium]|nr:TonB-dependent receptor [Betaproteobacteria bacterium]
MLAYRRHTGHAILARGIVLAGLDPTARAGSPAGGEPGLLDLPLEALVDLRVTSVAKRDQKLSEAAAAIFVLTADELRRSGVTTLPEALRLVPGLEVARISSGSWAVSARGSNSRFANKLLVLVDGRSVYTPLFSGVFWDAQDIPLEDVERVEVIRGPGASLWGANAVNGVINVITRSAAGTLGTLAAATVGNVDRATATLRHGYELAPDAHLRLYAKAAQQEPGAAFTTDDPKDRWKRWRAGFRVDRSDGTDSLTVQGEALRSEIGDALTTGLLVPPYTITFDSPLRNEGAHVRGLWRRQLAGGSSLSLQAYVDQARIEYVGAKELRRNADLEFQHTLRPAAGHDFTWGLGYRLTDYRFEDGVVPGGSPTLGVSLDPSRNRFNLASVFAQDEVTLVPERLKVVAGARIDHTEFTGNEFQPNLRIAFTPDRDNTVWAAISRAVRSPAIIERDSSVRLSVMPPFMGPNVSPFPALLDVRGSRDFASEELVAIEAGWRTRLSPTFSIDLAAYRNRYDHLRATVFGQPSFVTEPVPHVLLPLQFTNEPSGTVSGLEAAIDWRPLPALRFQGAYTGTRTRFDAPDSSLSQPDELDTPEHQFSLRVSANPRPDVDLDFAIRHVGRVQLEGITIPRYTALDARAGWRIRRGLEIWIAGSNLGDRQHPEYLSDFLGTAATQVRRSIHAGVRWTF